MPELWTAIAFQVVSSAGDPDGWLQTLRFVPRENKIHVEAYSPLLKKYNRQPGHTYTLEYVMSAGS